MAEQSKPEYGKHWSGTAEINWRRWGFGVEVDFGAWVPREWGVYCIIGPILLGLCREENWWEFAEAQK